MRKIITILLLAMLVGAASAAWYPQKANVPVTNYDNITLVDDKYMFLGTGADASMSYDSSQDKFYINDTPIYLEEAVTAPAGITGPLTGTASRIAVGSFIDTSYGLKNDSTNKLRVNLSADMGLAYDTGARLGALKVVNGHGMDLGASGVEVDPDDIRDPLSGLVETTSNHLGVNLTDNDGLGFGTGSESGALIVVPSNGIKNTANGVEINFTADKGLEIGTGTAEGSIQVEAGNGIKLSSAGVAVEPTDIIDAAYGLKDNSDDIRINLSASSGLEFGTGATEGALKVDVADKSLTLAAAGISLTNGTLKRVLAAGTAQATAVTIAAMAVGDELISVVSYTTAAEVASMADRTAEYAVSTGQLSKAAGTDESNNQLDIWYIDRTA